MLDPVEKPGGSPDGDYGDRLGVNNQRDTTIQIALSIVLGLSAFLAFCFLRTKWKSLYAARKQQRSEAEPLPNLPDTFFGWIPGLWRVTEQQVLASAGLDAYVFLRFFKLAIKFLTVTLFFALVVIKPVHDAFPELERHKPNKTEELYSFASASPLQLYKDGPDFNNLKKNKGMFGEISTDYLWMYLVFAYIFTGLAVYLLITETERFIGIRQQYLGSRSTITDRTIRLSGIPHALQSREKIKDFIESLQIGKVDSVTLCCNWEKLDKAMASRMEYLRKLEESWTIYNGRRPTEPEASYQDEPTDADESGPLLPTNGGRPHLKHGANPRPQATLRFGFWNLRSVTVDAINYYEEKLRKVDEDVETLRSSEFPPTSLAFVTMESTAACQMAIQAVLDPTPMQMIAKPSPPPGDVVWSNTYLPRRSRMTRGWMITIAITILTVFWSLVLVPLATALNTESIHKVFPKFADSLDDHPFAKSLVNTQLPTLLSSVLFVLVPYLYDWLASLQGMTSQSDIDISVVSKNFFFLFFNYFVIFSVLGTFSNFYKFFEKFQDSLKDTTRIAYTLATSLQNLLPFYTNLVILQGVGLFPLRLLEFGSVFLYPFYRFTARTPRDFAELNAPPMFYYGFYLPNVMLIFIICIVYSILRDSWQVLLAGLFYFMIGGFVYKYQLLYAMDHRQHSTGAAWRMICNRMIIGLLLFQVTTAGQLALKGAFRRSAVIAPLILATLWFYYAYSRTYTPLMRYIALQSIERTLPEAEVHPDIIDPDGWGDEVQRRYNVETRPGHTVDDSAETGTRFVNPNLISPLEDVWLDDGGPREAEQVDASSHRARFEGALNAAV